MWHHIRYLIFLFVIFLLLRTGVSGRKRRKSSDQKVKKPAIKSSNLQFPVKRNQTICLPCHLKKKYKEPRNTILIAWKKDGSPIKSSDLHYTQEESCLRIRNITSYDHGKYTCEAHNRIGSSIASRYLIVTDRVPFSIPPVLPTVKSAHRTPIPYIFRDTIDVIQSFSRMLVAIGRKMRLRCLLKGDPSPDVYWMFNGRRVIKDRKYLLRQRNFSLVIKKFTITDAGNYTCHGTNSAGKASMTYLVKVKRKPLPSPTEPVMVSKKVEVQRGGNLTLTCKVPAKDVQYLIWNVPIKPVFSGGGMERGFRSGDLSKSDRERINRNFMKRDFIKNGTRVQKSILINVTKEIHEGVYKCVALFQRHTKVVTVKMIEVVVLPGPTSLPENDESNSGSEFPLNVVLPAACVAFFLLVLFFCICFVFRQKLRETKSLLIPIQPPQSLDDGADEQANMQILPMCNYNSLKTNSKTPQRTSINSSSEHIECKLSSNITLNNTLPSQAQKKQTCYKSTSSLHNYLSKNSDSLHTSSQISLRTSNETSSPLPVPSIDSDIEDACPYKEDQRLLLERPCVTRVPNVDNSASNSSLCSIERQTLQKSVGDSECSHVKSHDDIVHIPRKMKNWESLLRTSCPSNTVETRVEEKLRSP